MEINAKLIQEHIKEKRESRDFKERRFSQWNENYALYRDKVATNRLTQRQPINIPVMRETIQTWISKIDEPPVLQFQARGRSERHANGEILLNELWAAYFDKCKLDIMDNLDKKTVGLQGRSFKFAGFSKGQFFIDLVDPYDIEISPRVNPLDINSAQYLIRTNIYTPIREILANSKYEEEAKRELKMYLDTKEGLIQAKESYDAYTEKMERLKNLGAQNFDDYNASELLVEVNESYKMVWNVEKNQYIRHLIKIAADRVVLYNKPLKEAIGINRIPGSSWADDPDLADFWCDGKGDSVRTINKVLNMYISQDVENRAYRNFGMYFYDTKNGTFRPRAVDPKPFGMYGVPGNPKDVMQQMRIEPLGDTTNQISFLKDMIQNSVAQTASERGEQTKSRTTLGEVELNLQNSGERNTVTSKNYRRSWEETGELFYLMMKNNSQGAITLHKKGANGEMYSKEISRSDWDFPEGYSIKVVMKSEKDSLDQFELQRAQYAIQSFADNPMALKIAKRKQLEVMGWSSEEVEQAMQFEDMKTQQIGGEQPQDPEVQGQAGGRPFNNAQTLQQETA